MLASSLLLIELLGFDYEHFRIAVFRPYPLVAYCMMALWFGLGIDVLMQFVSQRIGKWHKWPAPITTVSFSLIILVLGIWNGRTNYRADDRFAEQYAQILFDEVEQNAILVPHGDAYILTTIYYHLAEGKHPYIRLLEQQGLALNDRIVHPLWNEQRKSAAWNKFVRNANRPFYYQSLNSDLTNQSGQVISGFVRKRKNGMASGKAKLETNDKAKAFFKKMLALPATRDRWITHRRNRELYAYGKYLGYTIAAKHSIVNDYIKDVVPLAENNYWLLVGMADTLLTQNNSYLFLLRKNILKKQNVLTPPITGQKGDDAHFLYLEGRTAQLKNNQSKVAALFRQSIKIDQNKDNPACKSLQER